MEIEPSLKDFLSSGKQLEYDISKAEPGYVGLHKFDELKVDKIWIEGEGDQKCYYEVPAISITGENEYYDPEFILLWLPNERKYATWDSDRWDLYLFEDSTWNDIIKDPLPYLNYQWTLTDVKSSKFDPSDQYGLIIGWPF
ncbi:hypothetical protein [Persicobacter sp. CCB-QB2]|uniref:hypothetical protein n=1 Tax=Persicobacter sp. CCB-QB2 TaxID=1561025 RepID=UPI0006A9B5A1|nr:hypothetical protein [Persicobacter sp. CCB-QB2]